MAPPAPFLSPPPRVTLIKGFGTDAYDNAVATARTCYSSRVITVDDVRRDDQALALRDRIAHETYEAGHHTTLQHATFQFTLEHVSRQALWSFLHAHPFYNSEQVSQRYVEVKPGNVVLPALPDAELAVYRAAVARAMAAYQRLITLLTPRVQAGVLPAVPRRGPASPRSGRWASRSARRRPPATCCPSAPSRTCTTRCPASRCTATTACAASSTCPARCSSSCRAWWTRWRASTRSSSPRIEDPLPLEATLEYRALASLGRLSASHAAADFVREFDAGLGPRRSRLVDWKVNAEASVADAVREVLGVTRVAAERRGGHRAGALAAAEPVPGRGAGALHRVQAHPRPEPRALHLPEEALPHRRQPGPAAPHDARLPAGAARPLRARAGRRHHPRAHRGRARGAGALRGDVRGHLARHRAAARRGRAHRVGALPAAQRLPHPLPRVRRPAAPPPQVGAPALLHRAGGDLARLGGGGAAGARAAPGARPPPGAALHAAPGRRPLAPCVPRGLASVACRCGRWSCRTTSGSSRSRLRGAR